MRAGGENILLISTFKYKLLDVSILIEIERIIKWYIISFQF